MTLQERCAFYAWMMMPWNLEAVEELGQDMVDSLSRCGKAHLVCYLEECYTLALDLDAAIAIQTRELERFLEE